MKTVLLSLSLDLTSSPTLQALLRLLRRLMWKLLYLEQAPASFLTNSSSSEITLATEDGNYRFHLAKFVSFSNGDPDWLQVNYLGTTTAKSPFKFANVWIDKRDGKAILTRGTAKPKGKGVSTQLERWSGVDPAANVLSIKPALTKNGALTAATLKSLGKWKPHIVR